MEKIRDKDRRRSPAEVARWCGSFETSLRERGLRVTGQRLAVYRALAEDRTHPTAAAVRQRVRAGFPTISVATVYRILESLEREGLARRVSDTGAAARFDANLTPHQHLVCRVCGCIVDHQGSACAVPLPEAPIPGFTVEELDIRLVGVCDRCKRKAVRAADR